MLKAYIVAAATLMFCVIASYVLNFFVHLGYGLSTDTETWGQFADYVGGMLNPILSSISIIFLIKSLALQNEANQDLRNELKNNEKTERFKSFGALFFNMIDSQKALLENFSIDFKSNGEIVTKQGIRAIIEIEEKIEQIRNAGGNNDEIRKFLEESDSSDQIFGILRAFYITVKMISEKLGDPHGFSRGDRSDHFLTLINFTDFAQLRLVLIGIQFLNYPASSYLKENQEFCSVLTDAGLHLDPY
ncbi:hypothetical protein A9P79_01300 [Cupriavidus taiwanensis]|uniref:hypothetical protein n=1 Tax=Cupriavidus taiwanensis TaxID=164546 RepID=UPI001F015391|nr:hypothetical protein [Cupriavidus taiwanensis]ULX50637.1 hypothetical protein A9P79_01300 [Cupriavidus taiwanensis]